MRTNLLRNSQRPPLLLPRSATKERGEGRGEGLHFVLAALLLLLAALLLPGCGGPRPITNEERLAELARAIPPEFLTGQAAVLLTNAGGFTARLETELPSSTGAPRKISGKLFVKGPHLAFAPAGSDTSFLWDVSTGSGLVLNAPLQGYAPITTACRVTNLILRASAQTVTESVNGESCNRTDATLITAGCPAVDASVWRTANAAALPVRVTVTDPRSPRTIDLRDVRAGNVADELFQPPEGLTRYPDAQSMMSELVARRIAVRRKPTAKPFGEAPDLGAGSGR